MAKARRHHNNKGYRQIKRGKTALQVRAMCRRLRLPFRNEKLEASALEREDR